ncbi:ADP-ribosylhydrolase ARH3-like [Ptychodera flava]|uniref:ADP-ribosylhydrolase ARH3-like n=1 Tax=Ptychodera flava TaxID=63121 RepID=UPI003969CCAE
MFKMATAMPSLLSRFCGCLAAAVAGDVLGSKYEGLSAVLLGDVVEHVEKHSKNPDNVKTPEEFTDDTAMARSVAASLIENKGYIAKDMANRFATEFKKEPFRGYGANVVTVFDKLLDPSLTDVYKPARDQFNGSGSYGNGGAMRIAPVALFTYDNIDEMKRIAKESTLLTHSHRLGYNGAILECAAVHRALHSPAPLDAQKYIDELIEIMNDVELEEYRVTRSQSPSKKETGDQASEESEGSVRKPYCEKLKKIKELLENEDTSTIDVVDCLGHDISAHESVPTAIYSFVRSLKPIPSTPNNGLVRTIVYAISLGGDTDTIATMAGAIAGAYYGMESVPESWKTCCEGVNDAIDYANQLHRLLVEK